MRSKFTTAPLTLTALVAVAACALTAAPAMASGPPTAETKPATGIGNTTATLHGVSNPNGESTTVYFEYGFTTAYGKRTVGTSIGSGTTNVEVSKAIEQLAAGGTYHFRVVASNKSGKVTGADKTFTTTEPAGLPEFVPTSGKFPVTLTLAKISGYIRFEDIGPTGAECKGGSLHGEIVRKKVVLLTIEATGCEGVGFFHGSCRAPWPGAAEGHMTWTGLGSLVYINKAKKEVGTIITLPETFACNIAEIGKTRGGSVIPIEPVNKEVTVLKSRIEEYQGKQQFREDEQEGKKHLFEFQELEYGFGWNEAGVGITETLFPEASASVTVKA